MPCTRTQGRGLEHVHGSNTVSNIIAQQMDLLHQHTKYTSPPPPTNVQHANTCRYVFTNSTRMSRGESRASQTLTQWWQPCCHSGKPLLMCTVSCASTDPFHRFIDTPSYDKLHALVNEGLVSVSAFSSFQMDPHPHIGTAHVFRPQASHPDATCISTVLMQALI